MFPINQFKIETVSLKDSEGVFSIGPLPKGYAHTVGTVLRRILLSSIPGAAVTAVKMAGVQHEYTTIAGLKDDVLSIVLALKEIAVISHSDDPVELSLKMRGKKGEVTKVTAGDFSKNPMVEIKNTDLVITTLADEKSEIDLTIVIEKGIGYSLPEQAKRNEVGVIPIDAVFAPVKLAAIQAKNTRVGQQTDLDQLELKVITDGTVLPQVAVHQAAEILQTMTNLMVELTANLLSEDVSKLARTEDLPIAEQQSETVEQEEPVAVANLNLSTRLRNALVNSGYEDLRSLQGMTEDEVQSIKGMGAKSYDELVEILDEKGIKLV